MRPRAFLLLREQPHYRRDAFCDGLAAVGYRIERVIPSKVNPEDVLVVWNRYNSFDRVAQNVERSGGRVIVAENGYLGGDIPAPKFYAIALQHHNGAGKWFVGEEDRFSRMGVEVFPWRPTGDHILVLPQRGIGPEGVAMPAEWPLKIVKRLQAVTKRPIRFRPHPGKERPPLEPDLVDAWAVVTWGSTAAVKALTHGIPVFHEMPQWIGAGAARLGIENLEDPFLGDRMPMLHRLAWAQWSVAEIAKGEPFRCLLQ